MASILLAVAVHEDNQAKVIRMVPERLEVRRAVPLQFRIAYHFPDTFGEQAATLTAEVRLPGRGPFTAETAMSDRFGRDDSRSGDLWIDAPPMDGETLDVGFTVTLRTLDRDLQTGFGGLVQVADLEGTLRLMGG